MINKQISSILLATSLFAINTVPVQAAKDVELTNTKAQKQLEATPGDWCFELPWMGLFCYEL